MPEEFIKPPKKRPDKRIAIYISGLLYAFHIALVVYINSSFLESFVSKQIVASVYFITALANLAFFIFAPKIIKNIGTYRLFLGVATLELLSLLGLSFASDPIALLIFMSIHLAIYPIILLSMDIFLESTERDESHTGGIRAVFLTLINVAFVVAPSIVALILKEDNFWQIYLISFAFLIPAIFLIRHHYREYTDKKHTPLRFLAVFSKVLKEKNLRNIYLTQFLLRIFYAWMIIYTPIYLHDIIGFEWSSIGLLFSIMLLPFILFELPAGKLADSKFGEKELLILGFCIVCVSLLFFPYISSATFLLWAGVLFSSRVGASLIEITTESYFFKHVDAEDSEIISFFRTARPLAFMLVPLITLAIIPFTSISYSFLVLGIIMLLGIPASIFLVDTR